MKKILFLFSAAAMPCLIVSMQNTVDMAAAKKRLRECYAHGIVSCFKPTTRAFMEINPEANESKILQRYIDEVVTNAMDYRKRDLPLGTIGTEYQAALNYTPTSPGRLDWILNGQRELPAGMLCCEMPGPEGVEPQPSTMMRAEAWKAKQKEIEERIAQQ